MARYVKEVRWRLSSVAAKRYMHIGRNLVAELLDRMVAGGVNVLMRHIKTADGTVIRAWLDGGVPIVSIDAAVDVETITPAEDEDSEALEECSMYMEAGMLDLGTAPSATPATLSFNPATLDGTVPNGRLDLRLTDTELTVEQGTRAVAGLCRATEEVRDVFGAVTTSTLDKQTAQFKLPASMWSGLMRRYVQALYGTPTAEYSATDAYPTVAGFVFTLDDFDYRAARTDGIIALGDYRYWHVIMRTDTSVEGPRITYAELTFTPCGELLRRYLREDGGALSVAQRDALVTYLLSQWTGTMSPYEQALGAAVPVRYAAFGVGSASVPESARSYGWRFNASGTEAACVHAVSRDPSAGSSRVATVVFSLVPAAEPAPEHPQASFSYGATVFNSSGVSVPFTCWYEGDTLVVAYEDNAQVSYAYTNESYECDDPDTPNSVPWHDLTSDTIGVCLSASDPCPGVTCDNSWSQETRVTRVGFYTGYGSTLVLHEIASSYEGAASIASGGYTVYATVTAPVDAHNSSCPPAVLCSTGLGCSTVSLSYDKCCDGAYDYGDPDDQYMYDCYTSSSEAYSGTDCTTTPSGGAALTTSDDCPGGTSTHSGCEITWSSLEITRGYGGTSKYGTITSAGRAPYGDCSALYTYSQVDRSKNASTSYTVGQARAAKYEYACGSSTGYACGDDAYGGGLGWKTWSSDGYSGTLYMRFDEDNFDWLDTPDSVGGGGFSSAQSLYSSWFVGHAAVTPLDSLARASTVNSGSGFLSCLALLDTGGFSGGSTSYGFITPRAQQSSGGAYGRHTSIVTDGTLPFADDDFAQFGGFPSTGANRFSYIGWA